jgi:hypothetical protein
MRSRTHLGGAILTGRSCSAGRASGGVQAEQCHGRPVTVAPPDERRRVRWCGSAVAGGSRALWHRIAAQVHARTQHFFERNFLPLTQVGRQLYDSTLYCRAAGGGGARGKKGKRIGGASAMDNLRRARSGRPQRPLRVAANRGSGRRCGRNGMRSAATATVAVQCSDRWCCVVVCCVVVLFAALLARWLP